jgi:hypothetical protein
MIRIYYHIYAIDGVESIIEEQLSLMETHFNFEHIINIGICLSEENTPIDNIIKLINKHNKSNQIVVCDIKNECNEFVTLDLIETHKSTFDDNDLIFYLHTKGASKQKSGEYEEILIWRNRMHDTNIINHNYVFDLFNSTDFNTYGLLLENVGNLIYSGNFWWVKGKYIKTINIENIEKNRWNAELQYIQNGISWVPHSEYTKNRNDIHMVKTQPPSYKKNKLI